MADRHAVASVEDERQHDENRTRDIHIGKRGLETANEGTSDAPNTTPSSTMHVSLEYLASGERQVQKSGHVDDDIPISALDALILRDWVDERVVTSKKCWIGIEKKMPDISGEVS